jgi:hypothetical protein
MVMGAATEGECTSEGDIGDEAATHSGSAESRVLPALARLTFLSNLTVLGRSLEPPSLRLLLYVRSVKRETGHTSMPTYATKTLESLDVAEQVAVIAHIQEASLLLCLFSHLFDPKSQSESYKNA